MSIHPFFGMNRSLWREIRKDAQKQKILIDLATLCLQPVALIEEKLFREKIEKTNVQAPLFVLGHFRSGTTLLHNLLSKDPQFSFPRALDVFFPEVNLLLGPLLNIAARCIVPKTRLVDNMTFSPLVPYEDEWAVCLMNGLSFYTSWGFPSQRKERLERLHLNPDSSTNELWSKDFLRFLRKVSMRSPNKTLVLKSPLHTLRIPLLLTLFPQARFIYIERDSVEVLQSMKHLVSLSDSLCSLESTIAEPDSSLLIELYATMKKRFEHDVAFLTEESLFRVNYYELAQDPLKVMDSLYTHFDFGLYSEQAHAKNYVRSLKDYKKNSYLPLSASEHLLLTKNVHTS